jgi:uncharacterized protein
MSHFSRVFFHPVAPRTPSAWPVAARLVLEASQGLDFVKRKDLVAIKLHVGEPGVTTYLPPEIAAQVASLIKQKGGRAFTTDTSVLYSGPRSNGVGHATVAAEHGFTVERVGAPFLPADGLEGKSERVIPIEGFHFREVGIASAIADADGLVVVSHATGHLAAGYGGTLKNLGMGCASRKGKLLQHSDTKPFIRQQSCEGCGACAESCPEGAITLDEKVKAVLDDTSCIGCGECIASCRYDAVGFRWNTASAKMQEKMADHALGVVTALKGKAVFLLGIVNLTKDCDCMDAGSPVIAKDVGFAASTDAVALDQAALDLVRNREGKSIDALSYPECDGSVQLQVAERIGLGSRRYQLMEV